MNELRDVPRDFIRTIIDEDLASNKHGGKVHTRFPPEPNGYLHVGHAKSICLNFGIAQEYKGAQCNLRFDDTNPTKEDTEYVESIKEDIKWLGFDWGDRLFNASDYFDKLYEYAIELIKMGKAYVCELNADEVRAHRGTLTVAGTESPHRLRTVGENLGLFERMKNGEFEDGSMTLRAKIDMASPNINMRDPAIYRIRKTSHHATGDKWCIYPMYDYTHCISDALEGITHSLCTLEFEDHRPLYDWFLNELKTKCHPQQIEFSRLEVEYMITSKRKLKELVDSKHVSGWDDPRMPTIAGMRRRGYTPAAIRDFCSRVGVTKKEGTVEFAQLENCLREDLDLHCQRVMAVLNPLKVIIENYPEEKVEMMRAINHPKNAEMGTREIPFSKVIYIERDDFQEVPEKGFFRLAPGREVRLRYAFAIKCTEVVKDHNGEITEIKCTYDDDSMSGSEAAARKIKGVIHWVAARQAVAAEIRLYDRLFSVADPSGQPDKDYKDFLNQQSLKIIRVAYLEPSLGHAAIGSRFQFERQGYFCVDKDFGNNRPVFNRIVTLRDTWAKVQTK